MARFLAYTSPARGHLYPLVPTLQELLHRGHDVAIRTLADEVGHMESLGVRAAPVHSGAYLPDMSISPLKGWYGPPVSSLVDRAKADISGLRLAIEEEQPDALLVDAGSWGAGTAAERSDLPWAYVAPFCLPIGSRYTPPFGLGLSPRRDAFGYIRNVAVRWLVNRQVDHAYVSLLNGIRSGLGLPRLREVADIFSIPRFVISYTAEPFEYRHPDWPESIRLVGPGLWDPPEDPPSWLAEIEQPLILVTCSSLFQPDRELVEVALAALGRGDTSIVVTIGSVHFPTIPLSSRLRIERFIPHSQLLSLAACVVCHGGMGITQKALAAGVPVCAVPFGRDQAEVARRVQVSGAGTRLPASRLRPDRLRAAVSKALGRKEAAEQVAQAFAAAGGPSAAADTLEKLVII